MGLFGNPHPDCRAAIVGKPVLAGVVGDLVIHHPGCDRPGAPTETVYGRRFTPQQAINDVERLIRRHKKRGGW